MMEKLFSLEDIDYQHFWGTNEHTLEFIRLIETTPAKVIDTAPAEEFACSMMLEPDLVASLRRKIAVMEAHRRDFLRLYKSYNK